MKLLDKIAENRYFYNLTLEVGKRRGVEKILYYAIGLLKASAKHRFNLYDYRTELSEIKGKEYIYTFNRFDTDITMYIPLCEKDHIQKRIINYADFYESRELRHIKDKYDLNGATILDIGANIGNHTVFFAKICKAGRMYCFEPIKSTFEILKKNIELNDLTDIVVLNNVGLGDKTEDGEIGFYDPDNIGSTSIVEKKGGSLKIRRLDDYEFDKVDFIKVDVEGFEYNMLIGAEKTLKMHSPKIMIEIFEDNFEKTNNLLNDYGYVITEEIASFNYIYEKS